MIAIIDYGAGNIKSLQSALTKLDIASCLTTDEQTIRASKAIILPGVGAFKDAMDALDELGLAALLRKEAAVGKPILGICLGMQLLYDESFEDGDWEGLGILKGSVNRITGNVKVPHMGWNTLSHHRTHPILMDIAEQSYVYFVHSYYIDGNLADELLSSCDYGVKIPAIVQKDNIYGIQFHPEKSGATGLNLLKNFGELIT
ncbi:imidazole glycerol phosphate synthase subunit HisH [Lentibacillus populi]|uniref:Imidazole glycerol phosphate synthase subunit HisH n=1 Tax=Lentibacillus populi TaxID=1827502 RepID=A0A9W5X5Q4_9BACI|nr:imidazole glycerol phosphate synthase subunit HisH [Lentibacillus populi]GGB44530.1 imidazole glycerol phosphate synthase subunit HisH [Lentibacillus populi]